MEVEDDKGKEGEKAKADGDHEDMELDLVKKLPKRYANQVGLLRAEKGGRFSLL